MPRVWVAGALAPVLVVVMGVAVDVDGRVIDRFRLQHGTSALCRPLGWTPMRLSSGPPPPRASREGSASAAR